MGYIDFYKNTVVVLTAFQAAAFVNEYLRCNREDTFGETSFNDALDYGCAATIICPLNDDVFGTWCIEPVGNVVAYKTSDIRTRQDLYYINIDSLEGIASIALAMFSERWRKQRTYTLRWTD